MNRLLHVPPELIEYIFFKKPFQIVPQASVLRCLLFIYLFFFTFFDYGKEVNESEKIVYVLTGGDSPRPF